MSAMEIIETLYGSFKSKDYEALRKICHKDLEWIQNKGFPEGHHHCGVVSVIKNVFKKFNNDWEYFKFNIEGNMALPCRN